MEDSPQHPYTAYYCEENIYHLVSRLSSSSASGTQVYAVFISNPTRGNLLFHQKAAEEEKGYVVWDYHVIVLTVRGVDIKIWDLDSDLGLEVDFEEYFYETFRPDLYAPGGVVCTIFELSEPSVALYIYQATKLRVICIESRFRVVPSSLFLSYFASDRSHMLLDGSTTEYIQPPPIWQAICSPGAKERGITSNLFDRWLDIPLPGMGTGEQTWQDWEQNGEIYGKMYDMEEFEQISAVSLHDIPRHRQVGATTSTEQGESPIHDLAATDSHSELELENMDTPGMLSNTAELVKKVTLSQDVATYLPRKQLVLAVLASFGINFALPFVNGVMLGFGEIFARDWLAPYIGLTSWSSTASNSASRRRPLFSNTTRESSRVPKQRGGKQDVPGHPGAKSVVETVVGQAVSGGA